MTIVRKTYRFVALMLAYLMLTASMGSTMDMHYCLDELQTTSIFGYAETCCDMGKARAMTSCEVSPNSSPTDSSSSISQKKCCYNETAILDLDANTALTLVLSLDTPTATLPSSSFSTKWEAFSISYTDDLHLKWRLPARDIPVFFQTFLI